MNKPWFKVLEIKDGTLMSPVAWKPWRTKTRTIPRNLRLRMCCRGLHVTQRPSQWCLGTPNETAIFLVERHSHISSCPDPYKAMCRSVTLSDIPVFVGTFTECVDFFLEMGL